MQSWSIRTVHFHLFCRRAVHRLRVMTAQLRVWWRVRLDEARAALRTPRLGELSATAARLDAMEPRLLMSAAPSLSIQVADQGALSAFNFNYAKNDQTKIAQVALVNSSNQDIHIANLGGLREPFFVTAADDAAYDGNGGLVVRARDGVILNLAFRPDSGERAVFEDVLRVVADDGSVMRFAVKGLSLRQDVDPSSRVKVITSNPTIDPDYGPPVSGGNAGGGGGASNARKLAQPQPPKLRTFSATTVVSNARQLTAAAQQEGSHILLRPGTYTLDSLSLAPGVQIIGAGMHSTTVVVTAQWGSLSVSGGNRVADLAIVDQGDDAAVINNGTKVQDVLIERVRIVRGNPSGVFGAFARLAILDSVFDQADQHLLYIRNSSDVRIEGNRFGNAGITGIKLVASGGSVERVLIRNNVFTGTNTFQHIGAKINGDWNENANRNPRSQELFDIVIAGNRFETGTRAVALFEVDNADGLTIRNNTKGVGQLLWDGGPNVNVSLQ